MYVGVAPEPGASSFTVDTVNVALPDGPIEDEVWPSLEVKLPSCDTVAKKVMCLVGAGLEVTMKVTSPPSVIAGPPTMLNTGGEFGFDGVLVSVVSGFVSVSVSLE